jgi:NAD(P)-dependent dehydrogenase (short-subunit alcohol dehydrogenase family)
LDVTDDNRLRGKRVLAVGASSGAGRAVAESLSALGAQVAFAARRREKVEANAAKAGNGAIGIECDVCDDDSCRALVERTVAAFGGLDAVLYTPAIIAMSTLMDADGAYWSDVLRTNVVGAAQVTRAAVPHLGEQGRPDRGRLIYFSSVSASGTIWPGLGVYITSKAALERMVEAWRAEHPEVLFTCMSIGPIGSEREPDDFPSYMNTEQTTKVVATHMPGWHERQLARPPLPDTAIAQEVASILESSADIERVVIQAPW